MHRFGDVSVDVSDDFVAVVEIHRPPDNYFDAELITAIADAFHALDADDGCRAIVLQSEGKHFCAGANFGSPRPLEGSQPVDGDPTLALYRQAVRLLEAQTPVVAAVQGASIGGGLGLACIADFRVATPAARFAANFARLGFHHGFGLSVTLPEIVGRQHALDLLYTGRRIAGDEAARIGLVDRLVEPAELSTAAREWAAEIAGSAPLAVRSIRTTLRGDLAGRVRAAVEREASEQAWLRDTDDFREGVRAMAERRPPNFTGR
jgi:2-(1,2-epoxy-1,2-dihydrophenyl)acetyl-CoA isomerase